MLQRHVVESQRCSTIPAHVHLQPNHYRPRRRRARRQILSSLLSCWMHTGLPYTGYAKYLFYLFTLKHDNFLSGAIIGKFHAQYS